VLRADVAGKPTFRELLRRVRRVTLEAYDHQDVPFERLVEELRPERATTHNPLFRAAFSLQNTPLPPAAPPGLVITPWETHTRTAKFDLVLALTETGEGLAGDVEYSSELFNRATIRELIVLYRRLLECVAEDPDRPLLEIPLAERRPAQAAIPRETFEFCGGERTEP
jgi:non-ribosomal peptide synthetase component F